jgi:transposase InsO family protein
VGWAMATHLRTELVLDALNMALGQRRADEVIHHSDQGCQYTSIAFGLRCKEAGVRPSDLPGFFGPRTPRKRLAVRSLLRVSWRTPPG